MIEIAPTIIQKGRAAGRWLTTERTTARVEEFGGEPFATYRGFLGEQLFIDFHGKCHLSNHWNYDIVTDKGNKVDVKTVACGFRPKPHYCVNVISPDLNKFNCDPKDRPDIFVFFRILKNCSKAWLVGYKRLDEYKSGATFMPKGSTMGKMIFKRGDALVLEINKLERF